MEKKQSRMNNVNTTQKKYLTMFGRKLDRMHHPPANLDRYDNEEYMKNPLLKFRLADVYERRHHMFLKYRAAEVKMKLASKRLKPEPDVRYLPESHYVDNLRRCVRKIVVPKMLLKTEKQILSYAPKHLKQKLPELVKTYMKDVHDEYDRLMKVYSMKTILVKPELPDEDPTQFELIKTNFSFTLPGKTEFYGKFVQNRNKIKQRLLIMQLPARYVLNNTEQEFPELLVQFDPMLSKKSQATGNQLGLGQRECISHKTLQKYCRTCLEDNTTFLRWTWYPKFICSLRRMYKKRVITHKLWPAMFMCIEGLINRQLNNLKQRTLMDLLRVCRNERKIPMLRLSLVCYEDDNSIDVSPNVEEIIEVYETMVKEIVEVGCKIEPIEPQIDPATVNQANEFLRINLNENYVNEFIAELREAIIHTYKPIEEYLFKYQTKYFGLYSQTVMDDLNLFLEQPRQFHEYFAKIDSYFEYINHLRSEPHQDYFVLAIINNEPAIKNLRRLADSLIARITSEITKQHIKTELDICAEFQEIKDRALEIPKTTEELLAAGEYMIFVKKEKLFELRQRIQDCLKVGTNLVELCEMSTYHFNLTITTINWLHDINEICDYNASQQENYKCIFEEHLQEVVKKLNEDIEELIPQMTIVNDMSDPKKFKEYYIMLQNFIDQLKTFDSYVAWINKEEKLFKIPQTQYPTLEILKTFVYPFATLMK